MLNIYVVCRHRTAELPEWGVTADSYVGPLAYLFKINELCNYKLPHSTFRAVKTKPKCTLALQVTIKHPRLPMSLVPSQKCSTI